MPETGHKSRRPEVAALLLTASIFLAAAWVTLWPPRAFAGTRHSIVSEVKVGFDRMSAAARLPRRLAGHSWATALRDLEWGEDIDSGYMAAVRSKDLVMAQLMFSCRSCMHLLRRRLPQTLSVLQLSLRHACVGRRERSEDGFRRCRLSAPDQHASAVTP